MPIYLVGIVGCLNDEDLLHTLKDLIISVSLDENGWSKEHINVLRESSKMLW
jgi:hypothetical protein